LIDTGTLTLTLRTISAPRDGAYTLY